MNRLQTLLTSAFFVLPALHAQDEDRGKLLVESQCGACHEIDKVKAHRDTKAGWEGVVNYMISRGMAASDEDVVLIVDYLAKTYPAGPAPAKTAPVKPAQ